MKVKDTATQADLIRLINDACRQSFTGCLIVVTAAFSALDIKTKSQVLIKVREFKDFNPDNDPYGEHELVFVEHEGQRYFGRMDYYGDAKHETGAEDSSDIDNTWRVLTIGKLSDM